MIIAAISVLAVMLLAIAPLRAVADDGRIRPYDANPRYWQYDGKPILLVGGSDEDNLFNDPQLFDQNMAMYERVGGNYIRSTLSWRDPGNVPPFLTNDDGQYDLERVNPAFFDRFEYSLKEAQKRGVIVQIELWATFDYYGVYWEDNPFNPKNNVNYSTENTRLPTSWNDQPYRGAQPFFFTAPDENDDPLALKYQRVFAQQVTDIALQYPNVLYCIDNETMAPESWCLYWGRFIRREAEKKGVNAYVTEMWDPWDIRHEIHARTYNNQDVFGFTDISQNNWQIEQTHYDRLMWYREMLAEHPGGIRPMNNVKVYQRQGGGLPNDPLIGLDRWWQNLLGGCASTRFHRPPGGSGGDGLAQNAMRSATALFGAFDVFTSEPSPDLFSDRADNEAYCLANDDAVALYFPKGGSVGLNIEGAPSATIRWFDVEKGAFAPESALSVDNGAVAATSPNSNDMWLAIVARKR
ncbi:MAG: hypothetical protein O3A46_15015 [Candidatus Poribacteria bacterium]|nr:hypothetical protein [Candidatus Poribacteria bacterium]